MNANCNRFSRYWPLVTPSRHFLPSSESSHWSRAFAKSRPLTSIMAASFHLRSPPPLQNLPIVQVAHQHVIRRNVHYLGTLRPCRFLVGRRLWATGGTYRSS